MSNTKLPAQAREGYPELHEFDGAEYVKASDYDSRLHSSDVYFDSWKNTEAQFNQQKLEMDAACGEIALLKEELETYQMSASHQLVKGIVKAAVSQAVAGMSAACKATTESGLIATLECAQGDLSQAMQIIEKQQDLLRRVIDSSVLSFEQDGPELLVSLEADICAAIKPTEGCARCMNCDRATVEQCDDAGCGFLGAGNGAPDNGDAS